MNRALRPLVIALFLGLLIVALVGLMVWSMRRSRLFNPTNADVKCGSYAYSVVEEAPKPVSAQRPC
jgi:hypothetical protein